MRSFKYLRTALSLGAAAALLALGMPALAQTEAKSVVVEAVAAVPAFSQWVNFTVVAAEPVPVQTILTIPWAAVDPGQRVVFEALPVIVGIPELPLVGAGVQQAARNWAGGFNYQGMHVRLLVLDRAGRRVQSRSLAALPQPGERFKIRVTATFDAVTDVNLVLGEPWTSQRAGQMYPTPGMSVQMNAGETVDLPLESDRFFVMGSKANERLVLSVRHPQATGQSRTSQPAYRQDGSAGSSYLQLAPQGSRPAMEQLITAAR